MQGPVFDDVPTVASLGTMLLSLRNLCGLSQRELAKRAGLTNSVISTIEQGKVSPSVSSLAKLLDGLGVSLSQFYALDEPADAGSLKGQITQRSLFLAAGTLTQLLFARSGGVSLACSKGSVVVRTLSEEHTLSTGESLTLPAACAYVLENNGVDEASLWSASIST